MNNHQTGWNLANSYINLPQTFYTQTNPAPVQSPALVAFNEDLAVALGLDQNDLKSEEGTAVLAGNALPSGSVPLAQAYVGHQFGHFTMLGDGRAILLGEQMTAENKRHDIQLKGAGRTPYSRGGDGRAALGPMLREYMISEAMHGLGIPTTRALAVVTTGERIQRETELPGAILTRVAASHLRVGTFQYAMRYGTADDLNALAEYAIERHFPDVKNSDDPYIALLREVIERQAELIAKWQLTGFIHGVMNTDNMTISGESIDYGPCAFMNTYDPATVFSSIDQLGRYAYGNQPPIAQWNLARLAEALLPIIDQDEQQAISRAEKELKAFPDLFYTHWTTGMRGKLGLFNTEKEDKELAEELLGIMKTWQADYTNTFLDLTYDEHENAALFSTDAFKEWYNRWQARLERQSESWENSRELMLRHNPAIIPRNHLIEEALASVTEDNNYEVMEHLLDMLAHPFDHTKEQMELAKTPVPKGPYRTYCGT